VVGVDDQEIDRADVPTRHDRWTKGQDGPTHDVALGFGDEDAGLRQIDELTKQIRGRKRPCTTIHRNVIAAQRDKPIDVRDTSCSDQVFHAEGSYLAGRRPFPLERGPSDPTVGTWRPATHLIGQRQRRSRRVNCTRDQGAADRYCIQVADA